MALELAKNNRAAEGARHSALDQDTRTPQDAITDANSTVTDFQKQQDDMQSAYDAIQSDPLGNRMKSAWDEVTRTQNQLNNLVQSGRGSGTSLEAVLNQLDAVSAARDLASARLAEVKAGARQEQIDAAQAQVASAESQVKLLQIQLGKYTIVSPRDGVITSRGIELGETTGPGAILFQIGDLKNLQLTVYLPEDKFGLMKQGDQASVKADAYPGRTFTATVDRLADQAEFTPRNVQTVEGRRDTVFAVYLKINNDDLALKPGMWADVTFQLK
jgi:HlyD family secretion protein